MTVKTLMRYLNDFDPNDRVRFDHNGNLLIGKDFMLPIPTKRDREIEKIFEEQQGLYRED